MLTQYHHCIIENHKEESVPTLRMWVLQETKFMTIASETVHGFTGTMANNNQARPVPRYGNQRTFFGETEDLQNIQKLICPTWYMELSNIWSEEPPRYVGRRKMATALLSLLRRGPSGQIMPTKSNLWTRRMY